MNEIEFSEQNARIEDDQTDHEAAKTQSKHEVKSSTLPGGSSRSLRVFAASRSLIALVIPTVAVLVVVLTAGCAHQPPPTTRPSIATTQPSYWLAQPASVHISSPDFNRLWKSCEEAARSYGFSLDRQDYRDGILTTAPLTSKQWFEVWRDDVLTPGDLADSSINAYRRTIRFVFKHQPDGTFDVTPEIVIERQVIVEHPISASVYLRNAFRDTRGTRPVGTAEADEGLMIPGNYWYATGRDTVLEKSVAKTVEHWMKKI